MISKIKFSYIVGFPSLPIDFYLKKKNIRSGFDFVNRHKSLFLTSVFSYFRSCYNCLRATKQVNGCMCCVDRLTRLTHKLLMKHCLPEHVSFFQFQVVKITPTLKSLFCNCANWAVITVLKA